MQGVARGRKKGALGCLAGFVVLVIGLLSISSASAAFLPRYLRSLMGPIRPARSSCCCSPRLMRRMDRRFATERCRAMSPRECIPQSLQSSIFVLTVAKRRVRAPHCISARKDLSCLGHPRFRQPQRDGMTITVVTSITGAPGDGCDGSLGLTGHRAREAGQSPDQSNPSPQASRRPGWGHAPNCAPASIAVRCPTWHTYRIVTAWKCVEKQKALRCLAGPCLGVLVGRRH